MTEYQLRLIQLEYHIMRRVGPLECDWVGGRLA
jgi:hypothetical protein